jgi:hypothetical protein
MPSSAVTGKAVAVLSKQFQQVGMDEQLFFACFCFFQYARVNQLLELD